ncbi:MAG: hypothetical protein R2705_23270 [Ilumatobacteraceae bacterium]
MLAPTVLASLSGIIRGRTGDREVLASVALSWYATTGIYIAVWFLIYVTK